MSQKELEKIYKKEGATFKTNSTYILNYSNVIRY